jgi:hypothetical protein
MKIIIKKEDLPKRRNPAILEMRKRKSGSHEKPYKTKRAQEKVALKKLW